MSYLSLERAEDLYMFESVKRPVKGILRELGMRPEVLMRIPREIVRRLAGETYSKFDEELLIQQYDATIAAESKRPFVVDIAASDGVTMSNTYALFRSGMPGLAVECDDARFASLSSSYSRFPNVQLLQRVITPENVVDELCRFGVPRNFSLLNLDIDGYDHFVLDALFAAFRPTLVCAEVNEKIPPPLKFTVLYRPSYSWNMDHFFGQSISQLHELCLKHEYDLVDLHYNSAFLIPRALNTLPALTPEEAYDAGYRNKKDRKRKFPYNYDMDAVLTMSPEDARCFIDKRFRPYRGQYILS